MLDGETRDNAASGFIHIYIRFRRKYVFLHASLARQTTSEVLGVKKPLKCSTLYVCKNKIQCQRAMRPDHWPHWRQYDAMLVRLPQMTSDPLHSVCLFVYDNWLLFCNTPLRHFMQTLQTSFFVCIRRRKHAICKFDMIDTPRIIATKVFSHLCFVCFVLNVR